MEFHIFHPDVCMIHNVKVGHVLEKWHGEIDETVLDKYGSWVKSKVTRMKVAYRVD